MPVSEEGNYHGSRRSSFNDDADTILGYGHGQGCPVDSQNRYRYSQEPGRRIPSKSVTPLERALSTDTGVGGNNTNKENTRPASIRSHGRDNLDTPAPPSQRSTPKKRPFDDELNSRSETEPESLPGTPQKKKKPVEDADEAIRFLEARWQESVRDHRAFMEEVASTIHAQTEALTDVVKEKKRNMVHTGELMRFLEARWDEDKHEGEILRKGVMDAIHAQTKALNDVL